MVDYGMLPRERVVDLGDIVRGVDPGRTSEDDIYFFSIGGINTEDVSWGTTIYRKAVEMGLGQELKLWDTPALAYIDPLVAERRRFIYLESSRR